jgi:hypothetical protein
MMNVEAMDLVQDNETQDNETQDNETQDNEAVSEDNNPVDWSNTECTIQPQEGLVGIG